MADKYWLFDGKDAVGPFYSDELKRQPLFGPESLICPDGSEDPNNWRPARYYLIKPPGPQMPEPPRAPAPAPAAAPMPEPSLPSVITALRPEPAPERAAMPMKNVALAAAALLVPAAAYFAMRKPRGVVPPSAPAATTVAPAAAPAMPMPSETQANQEAVDFVLKFPVISEGTKMPGSADDIFTARRWKTPETVGEALDMKSFMALGQTASQLLQKRGRGPESGEAEVRRNRDHWDQYAQRFLKANYKLAWSTDLSVAGGSIYHVTGEARYHREGPREPHEYQADLDKRTLKPLNLDAWYDIDPKGCANWADKNVQLGEPVDEARIASAAPSYSFPLPKRGQHKNRHAEPPVASAKKSKKHAVPEPKPESALPPAEEADYPDDGAPAEDPLVSATSEPAAKPPAKPMPAPASKNAQTSTKPSPDKGASKPPANSPAAGDNGKSATDMSVDELEKYLNRGASKN